VTFEKDRRIITQANFAVHELIAKLTQDEKKSYFETLGTYLGMLKSFGESIENFIYSYKCCGMTPDEYVKETFSWSSSWKPSILTEQEEDWLLFKLNPAIEHLSQSHNNLAISPKISDAHDVLCKFKSVDGYSSYLENDQPSTASQVIRQAEQKAAAQKSNKAEMAGVKAGDTTQATPEKGQDKASSSPKIIGDTFTIWGCEINWRVCWDKLKKLTVVKSLCVFFSSLFRKSA